MLDLGAKVLVTTQQVGHGSGSGVSVSEPVFQLFTFRRGLVVRQEDLWIARKPSKPWERGSRRCRESI
jgi:hypothetical protein